MPARHESVHTVETVEWFAALPAPEFAPSAARDLGLNRTPLSMSKPMPLRILFAFPERQVK